MTGVVAKSLAERNGIEVGDVITTIDGVEVCCASVVSGTVSSAAHDWHGICILLTSDP